MIPLEPDQTNLILAGIEMLRLCGGMAKGRKSLETYARYWGNKTPVKTFMKYRERWRENGLKYLILDSGAFTVWTKGMAIDVRDYLEFIKAVNEHVDVIVNLDVIPGKVGETRSVSTAEREAAAQKGWDNYQFLLDGGVDSDKLVHIFHQGEDMKWLEMLMEKGGQYIGLSPANDVANTGRKQWLDQCMQIVCDGDGRALKRFHGFAATGVSILQEYPWFSADSASYLRIGTNGAIYFPSRKVDGKYDFQSAPSSVAISEGREVETESGATLMKASASQRQGDHFDYLSEPEQEYIIEYIRYCGEDPAEARVCYKTRTRILIHYYTSLAATLPKWADARWKRSPASTSSQPTFF